MLRKQFADNVAAKLRSNNPYLEFDPTIIFVIIELIEQILPVIIEMCEKDPKDVPRYAQAASGFAYRWLRRQCRRAVGWRDYYGFGGDKLLDAGLQTMAEMDEEVVSDLYSEICSTR